MITVDAPGHDRVLGRVPSCTTHDVRAAADRARAAQPAWAATPVHRRAEILLRFHDLLLERQAEVLDLIQLESGKARRHAFSEVVEAAVVARYYARTTASLLRPRRRRGLIPLLTNVTELRHPKGLVGIIAPWNYPLTLSISDAIPALAAGNAVLIKPDELTPFTTLWAASLLEEAGLPAAALQVLTGPGAVPGEAVVDTCDYIVFTGSTRTGRSVAARAAARLIECTLELGGKNALLVLDDADPDPAAEGAVRACFDNAGQLCISAERIYVAASLFEPFVQALVARTEALVLSPALDWSTDLGSLISRRQLAAVATHVDDAVARGARVLTGGRARPDIGSCFYAPTVLADVTPGMRCYADETFGPVVAVYPVADEQEAIRAANASEYGLSFSVWTSDPRRGRRVAARLEAGAVTINDGFGAAWGSIDSPMGGMKASGSGRRHGAHGLLTFTEGQTIAVQRIRLAPSRLLPPERFPRVMTASLRALRRVPWIR